MTRSVWKGPFVDGYLLNKAETSRGSGRNEIIKIWSRRSTILPQFVGLTFGVYNGRKFLPVQVNENMVGHKFGEFSPTRTFTRPCRGQESEAGLNHEQAIHPRGLADSEAQCIVSNMRVSPRKLNLVAAMIRNLPAQQAIATLTFSKRRIAQQVKKAVESAVANAENNHQLDVDRLVVSRAEVGRSMVMRRFHARGRGKAARVEKWFSHLKIVVAERAQESEAA